MEISNVAPLISLTAITCLKRCFSGELMRNRFLLLLLLVLLLSLWLLLIQEVAEPGYRFHQPRWWVCGTPKACHLNRPLLCVHPNQELCCCYCYYYYWLGRRDIFSEMRELLIMSLVQRQINFHAINSINFWRSYFVSSIHSNFLPRFGPLSDPKTIGESRFLSLCHFTSTVLFCPLFPIQNYYRTENSVPASFTVADIVR